MRPIVVVGDSLLDVDLTGRASRLVPDAPAPVLEDLVEQARPGGAALAAELAARGGRDVVLVTAWSDDAAGERLVSLLSPNLTLVRVPGGATAWCASKASPDVCASRWRIVEPSGPAGVSGSTTPSSMAISAV